MLISSYPYTYQQHWIDQIWKSSMEDEGHSLQESNTWELVPLLPKRKVVECKWVFHTKLTADGSDIKHKDILVAKGYSKIHGVDYTDTFAAVAKMDSIRLVLALAASKC